MEFMHEIENILFTSFKALPPLLLAGLGGMITYKIRVLNLGLEGMMLLGAFTAILPITIRDLRYWDSWQRFWFP